MFAGVPALFLTPGIFVDGCGSVMYIGVCVCVEVV